jgi:hemerythrin
MALSILHWKPDYDTGIEEIDLQHRFFVGLINRLGADLSSCTDTKHRARLLDEIAKYAAFHFVSEENLMIKLAYPEIDAHHKLHRSLINELSWRIQNNSTEEFVNFLTGWFIHHSVVEDRQIGEFMRSQTHVSPPTG